MNRHFHLQTLLGKHCTGHLPDDDDDDEDVYFRAHKMKIQI